MPLIETRLAGAPNFRDLGGACTADGRRLRHGRIFRSEVLSGVTDADLALMRDLGIAVVCDLRQPAERERQRNRWPTGHLPQVLGLPPSEGIQAVQGDGVQSRITQPDFDPEEARAVMLAGYRLMPRTLAPALRCVLDHLSRTDAAPLLIHCTSGKDRSGFVCAMVLTALDVPREAILRDYLLSHERYPVDNIRQMLQRALGDALPPGRMELLLKLATVNADYLAAAFAQIESGHGGVDAYLRDEAGLDAERRRRLQDALLI